MDQSLANVLAFWSGPDEDRLVRLMLRYGPKRKKWIDRLGTRSDYLRDTARKAIRDCDRFYGSRPAATPADVTQAKCKRFEFLSADKFFAANFEQQFLIDGVLVRNQPGVIAGPSKGMKTSLMIDMTVSLASGTPFLGVYPVRERARVALVSGESGDRTIQETARRVCEAKDVKPDDLAGWWSPCFSLPKFTDLAVMREFAGELVALQADVVIIDPVYLCVGGQVDHANLFEMGDAFRVVSDELLGAGCTPVLVHHANRRLQLGSFMEIHDLSYAGLEQFARQWLFVNRAKSYQGDGVHDLLVAIGGSAGHSGRLSVRVEEGVLNDDFTGRTWDVTVQTVAEAAAGRETAKQEVAFKRDQADEARALQVIDAEVGGGLPAATLSAIRTKTSWSGTKTKQVLDRLTKADLVESFGFQKPGGRGGRTMQPVEGFRRRSK